MENQALLEKIVETIRRDVNNIFVKASGSATLPIESQDALVRYYKLLTDAKLDKRERDLEELTKRAEEAIARATVK